MGRETYATVIPLCDGTRDIEDVAAILGLSRDAARMRVRKARRVTGMELPLVPLVREGRRPAQHAKQPACVRCGLRGEHVCVPSIEHYASSGATNLGHALNAGTKVQW